MDVPDRKMQHWSTCAPRPLWSPTPEAVTLSSRLSKSGGKCNVTCTLWGMPDKGDEVKSSYINPTFSACQKSEVQCTPLVFGGAQQRGATYKVPTLSLPSGGAKSVWNRNITLAFSGVPKCREIATQPLYSRDPQQMEVHQKLLHDPFLLRCPKVGEIAM